MRAMLLAAGFGTRLRPLTDAIPKCLVPIHGRPLLEIWLDRLTEAGIGPFLINTHYLASQVERFIAASRFRDQVTLVNEPHLLGTAGTLKANLSFFEGHDGLLIHADNYCMADFQAFIHAHRHRPSECLMTMMTFRTTNPSACGIVELDDRGVVIAFHEKLPSAPGNLANGAIYVLSAPLFARMRGDLNSASDFSRDVVQHMVGQIYQHETGDIFLDIGTPETYLIANTLPISDSRIGKEFD